MTVLMNVHIQILIQKKIKMSDKKWYPQPDELFSTRDHEAIWEWAYLAAKDGNLALCDPTVIDEIQLVFAEYMEMKKE